MSVETEKNDEEAQSRVKFKQQAAIKDPNSVIFNGEHKNITSGEFWRKVPAYANVSEEQFNDHKWQLKNSVTSVKALVETVREAVNEDFIKDLEAGFAQSPMAVRVTPYIMGLIDWENPYDDPLRLQFVPLASRRLPDHPELHLDTLHEQGDSAASGLTHRYPDKVLFLAGDLCPVYCRYCTRSYAVGFDSGDVEKVKLAQSEKRWEETFAYLENHPTVEDVVISGGDSYMLRASRIKLIGEKLLKMPNIRRIRFATKGPAIFPQKLITDHEWYNAVRDVVDMGRKMHKEVCIHTHFSHPNEITDISQRAMGRLMEDGITIRNQTVLQKSVNDTAETIILLNKRMSYINVQPYYIYMHDLVQGVEDLRTTLETGLQIEKSMRGTTAGFNTPLVLVDAPGGGGKRNAHSYEYYNRDTGISVYTAPSVKPGQYFMYFDPIADLPADYQAMWRDEKKREEMKRDALEEAKKSLR